MSSPASEMAGAAAFTDGLGIRVRRDGPDGEPLELLRLHPRLAESPRFEVRLRERTSRLANFRHDGYARVRRIDRTDNQLAVVSEMPPGPRLSRILTVAERHGLELDINAALCLVRQLVPAVALLHQNARDAAHGALAPERVVVTAGPRALITEYVLGAAIEQLQWQRGQLWRELRVAIPAGSARSALDHRADVLQLGLIALALVLGRPLGDEDLDRVPALIASATENSAYGGREPISDPLRRWLARSLQLDPRSSFESALEAQLALDNVLAGSGYVTAPVALETFLARFEACDAGDPAPAGVPPPPEPAPRQAAAMPAPAPGDPPPAPAPRPPRPDPAVPPARDGQARKESTPEARTEPGGGPRPAPYTPRPHRKRARPVASPRPPEPAPGAAAPSLPKVQVPAPPAPSPPPALLDPIEAAATQATPQLAVEPLAAAPRPEPQARSEPPAAAPSAADAPVARPRPQAVETLAPTGFLSASEPPPGVHPRWRLAALALAAIVLFQGAFLYWKYGDSLRILPVTSGTLKVESKPSGATVRVDGEAQGKTPLSVSVSAGAHVLEVSAGGEPRVLPFTIEAGQTFAQYLELAGGGLATGRLEIRSQPSGAAVLVDGQLRGRAPLDLSDVAAGEHEVVANLNGSRVRRSVTVRAGNTTNVALSLAPGTVVPTTGWAEFQVPYEMEVFENGRAIGTTIGRLPLEPGPHELDIVSETLAFRRRVQVNIGLGRVSRVPIALPQGSLQLDAVPWAEVFVDGERVGQTPLSDVPVTVGPHQILFRHPELGERHQAATVTAAQPARVSVDLTRP